MYQKNYFNQSFIVDHYSLQNLDQADGLCNGTRLIIVTRLGAHVVESEIITGPNIGHRAYIQE